MAEIINNNRAFSARNSFLVGGSVLFGNEDQIPDPDNPGTLKQIFTDRAMTIPAMNPQPLDEDAKFQQSTTGVLFGTGTYSFRVFNAAGVQVDYVPSYDVIDNLTAQQASVVAIEARDAAIAAANGISIPTDTTIPINVDNVTELRTIPASFLSDGRIINLAGHTNLGVGGGQLFVKGDHGSEVDDNGLTFVFNGKVVERKINGFVTPEMFGAPAVGTNDTSFVQSAMSSASQGVEVTGTREYLVTTVLPKQGTTLRNLRLKSRGNDGSSDPVSHIPVIRIGDNVNQFTGLLMDNVHVDGNRSAYSNINLFAGADGGMHGIHIRGRVRDVTLRDCSSRRAGTAGLALDWDTNRPPVDDSPLYGISNIKVVRCSFTENREHGSFAAYCRYVRYIDCEMSNNGKDLEPGFPENHGNHGAFTQTNGYFSRGLDIESYDTQSNYSDVSVLDGDYIGNANGAIQFFDPGVVGGNYRAAEHLVVKGAKLGLAALAPDQSVNSTLNIQGPNPVGEAYGIHGLFLVDLDIEGSVRVNGASGIQLTGTQSGTTSPDRAVEIFNSRRISTSLSLTGEMLLNDIETPVLSVENGSSVPAVALISVDQPVGGVCRATYRIFVTGAGAGGVDNKIRATWTNALPAQSDRNPVAYSQPATETDDPANLSPVAYVGTDGNVRVLFKGTGDNFAVYLTCAVVSGRGV